MKVMLQKKLIDISGVLQSANTRKCSPYTTPCDSSPAESFTPEGFAKQAFGKILRERSGWPH